MSTGKVQLLSSQLENEGRTLAFRTSHFSEFAIVAVNASQEKAGQTNSSPISGEKILPKTGEVSDLLTAGLGLLLIDLSYLVVRKKKS